MNSPNIHNYIKTQPQVHQYPIIQNNLEQFILIQNNTTNPNKGSKYYQMHPKRTKLSPIAKSTLGCPITPNNTYKGERWAEQNYAQ